MQDVDTDRLSGKIRRSGAGGAEMPHLRGTGGDLFPGGQTGGGHGLPTVRVYFPRAGAGAVRTGAHFRESAPAAELKKKNFPGSRRFRGSFFGYFRRHVPGSSRTSMG